MNKKTKPKTGSAFADAFANLEAGDAQPIEDNESKLIKIITGSDALAKACQDTFDYAMKLRTGEVIRFYCAEILNDEWVTLDLYPIDEQPDSNRIAYPAKRGMDVRISDIVWVMDAPEGS